MHPPRSRSSPARLVADGFALAVTVEPEDEPRGAARLGAQHRLQRLAVLAHARDERRRARVDQRALRAAAPPLVRRREVALQQVACGGKERAGGEKRAASAGECVLSVCVFLGRAGDGGEAHVALRALYGAPEGVQRVVAHAGAAERGTRRRAVRRRVGAAESGAAARARCLRADTRRGAVLLGATRARAAAAAAARTRAAWRRAAASLR